ncbi:MAG: hypothetical protein ACREXP_00185 [Steroidobacteraceae bacterium]
MTGAPIGNRNAAKRGRFREALDKALKRYTNAHVEQNPALVVEAGEALDKIAMHMVHRAVYGDTEMAGEIADRLDGRPAQAIIGGDDDDPALKLVHRIERVIVAATKPDETK